MTIFLIVLYIIGIWVAYHLHQMADGSYSLFVAIMWPIVLIFLLLTLFRDWVECKLDNWK